MNTLLNDFQNYLGAIKNYSAQTVSAYLNDMMQFAKWVKLNVANPRWSTITTQDIDRYVINLKRLEYTAPSINRKLSSISAFYNFLNRQGMKCDNPCRYECRQKLEQTLPNTISLQELQQAYDNAVGVAKVMIGILANTGMRLNELLSMKWSDIEWGSGLVKLHGKGMKERKVKLPLAELNVLYGYYEDNAPAGNVFAMGPREVRHLLYAALKPYCSALQLSPHAIRHTYATELAKRGVNVSCLAAILGHNNIATTQRYIDLASMEQDGLHEIELVKYNKY